MTLSADQALQGGPLVVEASVASEIEALVRKHYPAFYRVALAITGDHESALDAVQEALARAIGGHRRLRSRHSLEAWFWRILVNTARTARRRNAREVPIEVRADAGADDDPTQDVRTSVARLPERQRLVLFLRYYADLDYAEIARIVGIRRGTVSATLHRAQTSLRRTLAEEEEGP